VIYVVGHTAIDHICRVRDLPPPNGSVTIIERKVLFGGGAANIAAGIARLGVPCTLVSAVGDDFSGASMTGGRSHLASISSSSTWRVRIHLRHSCSRTGEVTR